ncbi:MAG: hypothetical protein AB1696_24525 [Planctomycetota bacterium]
MMSPELLSPELPRNSGTPELPEETKTKLSNVVVLGSDKLIQSKSFDGLRSTSTEKRAFLAGIDGAALPGLFKANEGMKNGVFVDFLELLTLTLEVAAGKEPPKGNPLIKDYNKDLRILFLLPRAEVMDYIKMRELYNSQLTILQAA